MILRSNKSNLIKSMNRSCFNLSRNFFNDFDIKNIKFDEIKVKITNSLQLFRGSVIETLGKRMSKKDADILNKYIQKISNDQVVSPIATSTSPMISNSKVENISHVNEIKEHPLFGQLVLDLGYKQVYCTNVKKLAMTPVWEKQRILRPERVLKIVSSKVKNQTSSRLLGVITLFHDIEMNKIGIIDGQHRAAALVMLAQQVSLFSNYEYFSYNDLS